MHTNSLILFVGAFAAGAVGAQSPATALPASITKTAVPVLRIAESVAVAPGILAGRVVHAGSRRPVADHPLQLLDGNGRKIADVVTSKDGAYATSALVPGSYRLQLREDLVLALDVVPTATLHELELVLPQGPTRPQGPQDPSKVPAAPGGAAPLANLPPLQPVVTPGLSGLTWAVIAGGAATAVAVPVAANQGGGGGENQVSASGLGVRR